jgi:hypothetical protein
MIGMLQVNRPSGLDVLNESIDALVSSTPRDTWKMVSVAVAPRCPGVDLMKPLRTKFTD